MRDATAAIAHRPGLFSLTTFSRPHANFLRQTFIVGLVNTCHHILDASRSEWYLGNVFLPRENQ